MYTLGYPPIPTLISLWTPGWGWPMVNDWASSIPTSSGWESALKVGYFPIRVPATCVVRRVWWANGATVSASYNIDCGIYRDNKGVPGAKIVSSGSTAQGTASQLQFVDVTDTVLAPGLYWLAMVASTSSATFFRAGMGTAANSTNMRMSETLGALPLPSTATPLQANEPGYVYVFGFATTASP